MWGPLPFSWMGGPTHPPALIEPWVPPMHDSTPGFQLLVRSFDNCPDCLPLANSCPAQEVVLRAPYSPQVFQGASPHPPPRAILMPASGHSAIPSPRPLSERALPKREPAPRLRMRDVPPAEEEPSRGPGSVPHAGLAGRQRCVCGGPLRAAGGGGMLCTEARSLS